MVEVIRVGSADEENGACKVVRNSRREKGLFMSPILHCVDDDFMESTQSPPGEDHQLQFLAYQLNQDFKSLVVI